MVLCCAGALAVVIAHDIASIEDESQRAPRTWCFCPDSLCMDSKPKGSNLPPWWVLGCAWGRLLRWLLASVMLADGASPNCSLHRPPKLPLEPGMKITRSEYNQLLELGLDVQAPAKKAAADGSK